MTIYQVHEYYDGHVYVAYQSTSKEKAEDYIESEYLDNPVCGNMKVVEKTIS